jgi:hypothetical protein
LANALQNPGFETGDFSGWLVGGVHGPAGVGTGGQLISGTGYDNFFVVVHSGLFAAFAPIAALGNEQITLSQIISISPNTIYVVGYFVGAASLTMQPVGFNSDMDNTIVVNRKSLQLSGLGQLHPGGQPGDGVGRHASDMRRVYGIFESGPEDTSATVTYSIAGSDMSRAGFSFDDFLFNASVTDTIGLFRPGSPANTNTFFLRGTNTLGAPDLTIAGFGDPVDQPLAGDWNGDGITTIGVFRPNTPAGTNSLVLLDTNSLGPAVWIGTFGVAGDIPIVGDWDGNGTTTIGLFRPNSPTGTNTFLLWNRNTPGPPDITVEDVGTVGDKPIVGDWDGNGTTTIGLFRPNSPTGTNTFLLRNSNTPRPPDITIEGFGAPDDMPIAGKWGSTGGTTIGLFRPNAPTGTNTFFLRSTNTLGPPDITITGFGAVGDLPVAGHWTP